MRRILLAIMLCGLLSSTCAIAAQNVIKLRPFSSKKLGHNIKRGPTCVPEVWIDGSMLIFPSNIDDAKIEIYKEGILVYSIEISEEINTLEIPNHIEGFVEFHLIKDDIDYIGYLELDY